MDISNKYCVYVGSARGALQCSRCKLDEKISYTIPKEQSEITALEWGRAEDEIIIGYKNEQVDLYSTNDNKYLKTISNLEGEGPVVGVAPLDKSIVIAKKEGIITIWNKKKSDYFSINLEENGTLEALLYNKSRHNVLGTGGECNDFKLWDIETKQCIFKAKSLGHDELDLPIPASIRGITFVPENERLSICATKEGHVLLYDDKAQRKAVVKFLEKKASYTCISSAFRERQCLVGTTRGYMQLIDMRVPGKCLKTFTTFTGSITSIACDPLEPFVATTSLDRFLRIHNLENKALVHKAYLKQNLTKVLMKPIIKEEKEVEVVAQDQSVDQEYEELFENMETISEPSLSKRKSGSENVIRKKKTKISSA